MKRFLCICICLASLAVLILPVYAAAESQETIISQREYVLDNGLTVIEEITETVISRSSTKYGNKKATIKDGDTTIAIIAFTAQFGYDGTSAWVVSKTVTQTDTYESWTYKQDSFTSSGSTVTLDYTLSRWLFWNNSYSMSLTCDKDGNLS